MCIWRALRRDKVTGRLPLTNDYNKIQTCHLQVNISCEGCKKEVKQKLQKIEGVYTVNIDQEHSKVTVSGAVTTDILIKKLAKSCKVAEVWGGNGNGGQKGGGGGGGLTPQQIQQTQEMRQTKRIKNLKMHPQFIGGGGGKKGVKVVEEDEFDDDDYDDDDVFDDDVFDDDDEIDDIPEKKQVGRGGQMDLQKQWIKSGQIPSQQMRGGAPPTNGENGGEKGGGGGGGDSNGGKKGGGGGGGNPNQGGGQSDNGGKKGGTVERMIVMNGGGANMGPMASMPMGAGQIGHMQKQSKYEHIFTFFSDENTSSCNIM